MKVAIFAYNFTGRRGVANITVVQIVLLIKHCVEVALFTHDEIPSELIKWSDTKRLSIIKLPRVDTAAFQVVKWGSLWSRIKSYLSDVDLVYVPDMWYGRY